MTSLFNYEVKKQLMTDEDGIIILGKLENVTTFKAHVALTGGQPNLSREWLLPSKKFFQFPQRIDIIEGELIELPTIFSTLKKGCIYMRSRDDQNTISNEERSMQIVDGQSQFYHTLQIKDLRPGNYYLRMGNENQNITITVHQGIYWEDNLILKKYSLFENSEKHRILKIKDLKVEETKEEEYSHKITIEVSERSKSTRLHLFGFEFMPDALSAMSQTVSIAGLDNFSATEFPFQKWTNFYLSNRELGTEYRYVFERRYLQTFTGNHLDKPKLLLKRNFIQMTKFSKEEISSGTQFQQLGERRAPPQQAYYQQQQQMPLPTSSAYYPHQQQRLAVESRIQKREQVSSHPAGSNAINFYQTFLQKEPLVMLNMIPDSQRSVQIKANFQHCAALFVIAVDDRSVAHLLYGMPQQPLKTKDLSLKKPMDSQKCFSEVRNALSVPKHESDFIQDLTSSDIQIVDSIQKVFMIQKEIMKLMRKNDPNLEKFEFIPKWKELDPEEKNKKLTLFTSHELHLFIKYKDPQYFTSVVVPYLKNKMEKTFIDNFLLGNTSELVKYIEAHKIEELNCLETVLLIEAICNDPKYKDDAIFIAKKMKQQNEVKTKNISMLNKIFDTVLSLNMLKEKKESEGIYELVLMFEII